jgi:hypothetical protein
MKTHDPEEIEGLIKDLRDVLATHGAGTFQRQVGAKTKNWVSSPGPLIGIAILVLFFGTLAIVGIGESISSSLSPHPELTLQEGTKLELNGVPCHVAKRGSDYVTVRWYDGSESTYGDESMQRSLNNGMFRITQDFRSSAAAEPEPDMTLLRKVRVGTLVTSDVGSGKVTARISNYTSIRWEGDHDVSYTDRNLATMLNTGSIAIR